MVAEDEASGEEHARRYTYGELQSCTPENYLMLLTNITVIDLFFFLSFSFKGGGQVMRLMYHLRLNKGKGVRGFCAGSQVMGR